MRALRAIFIQTLRASIRSRVFHVLLGLTAAAVVLLPLTVTSDGTAAGELKLSLTYSLTTVVTLLSLATVWLGCIGLSREIDTYQLHMVMTKPASGLVVWTGKWLAVFTMTASVFVFAAVTIYAIMLGRFHYQDFPEGEKEKAEREVLTASRVYEPEQPDYTALARERYRQMQKQGMLPDTHNPGAVMKELKRQARAGLTEIPRGRTRTWRFEGVNPGRGQYQAALRYRLYVASTLESRQRLTRGAWAVINPELEREKQGAVLRQRVMSGVFHEISLPAEHLAGTDEVFVQYVNLDARGESVIFQPDDGPTLLLPAAGFTANWLRACAVIILELAALAAVGCFFGAAFSPPVAVFAAVSCLFLGAVASPELGEPVRGSYGEIISWPWQDRVAHTVAMTLDKALVTADAGRLGFQLAQGRLIELFDIGKVIVLDVLIKGGLAAALGAWVLSRRELGKVIKQ